MTRCVLRAGQRDGGRTLGGAAYLEGRVRRPDVLLDLVAAAVEVESGSHLDLGVHGNVLRSTSRQLKEFRGKDIERRRAHLLIADVDLVKPHGFVPALVVRERPELGRDAFAAGESRS